MGNENHGVVLFPNYTLLKCSLNMQKTGAPQIKIKCTFVNTNVLVHSTGHNTLRYSVHSFYIPDQYFGILLYQCLYFNYIILCMILPRSRLGLAAMKEIPLYWSGLMKE